MGIEDTPLYFICTFCPISCQYV
uniref:Uncharacterized protein n=1 Tax=Arundo donax TaxID=35708 RepID=A0A0A9CH85_ARUDO